MDEGPLTLPGADLSETVLAKTDLGREEIRTRALRLAPLLRNLLVLCDGQRTLGALVAMMAGQDVLAAARQLLDLGCVAVVALQVPPPSDAGRLPAQRAASPVASAAADPLAGLPPPASRTAQQVDMARNFMINTINNLLEQNSRLTLVKQIFESQDAAALRQHEPDWEAALASSWMGKRRLPELRKKLFEVL